MPPIFQVNNLKPWAPPNGKPFPPPKPPHSRSQRTSNSPCPETCHESRPSTLPIPQHRLPVRPPAEVCMHLSTKTRLYAPLSPRNHTGEIPIPPPNTLRLESAKHGTSSRELAPHTPQTPHTSTPDRAQHDSQEVTGTPTELSCFPGDITEAGLPSPSISSLEDNFEEISRLPDIQGTISIDPAILANNGSWVASDQQQPDPPCDSNIDSETICPYPEPPLVLHNTPGSHQVYSECAVGSNAGIQTDHHSHIHGQPDLRPFNHNTEPDLSHSSNVSESSKNSKRKRQRSDGQAPKRLRVSTRLRAGENSVTGLCSHFLTLPLDGRLQFLSWLFEGVLQRCTHDSVPTREKGDTQSHSRSTIHAEDEQSQQDTSEAHGISRKGEPWTAKEAKLLLKLRRDEKRPWSEVTKLFLDQYPGRSPGSIQVYWSTNLKKRTG